MAGPPIKEEITPSMRNMHNYGKRYRRQRAQELQVEARDIGAIPQVVDMRRRALCRYNLRLFCETYFADLIFYEWSLDQKTLVEELQRVILHGSNKAVALPRGGGKSTLCLIAVIWAICFGHRKYIFLIRDTQQNANDSLDSAKVIFESNDLIFEDFPELAYPIRSLEGSALKAKMQTYRRERTYMDWTASEVSFPYLKDYEYLDDQAAIVLRTTGITGGVRGSNRMVPYDNEIIRPDLVILDDVQTDTVAGSPTSVERYVNLIDGSIRGLAGPGQTIAAIMPCTVIQQGDVSDTYLDRTTKPGWAGQRGAMVVQWPKGITDTEITDDTHVSKLWNKYSHIRLQSLAEHGDIRLATQFYAHNQTAMDVDFIVSWDDRFVKEGNNRELSAKQHAMNLRLENIFTFLSEYQNRPAVIDEADIAIMPQASKLMVRETAVERKVIPFYANVLVGMIDVQDEMLWYSVVALDHHYTGQIIEYGPYPNGIGGVGGVVKTRRRITKKMASSRKEMSWAYYKHHLGRRKTDRMNRNNLEKAPFEAKIRWGVQSLCEELLAPDRYKMEDGTPMGLDYLAIDVRWGATTDILKRMVAELRDSRIVPYEGVYVGASSRQLGEWARNKPGRVFEDQVHRKAKACRWIVSPEPGTGIKKLYSDVNAWKTFLMHRLTCPTGSPGAIQLYKGSPSEHDLFSQHICESEYPIPTTAKGKTVLEWKERAHGGWPDNDYLDTLTGCMALASLKGCRSSIDIQESEKVATTNKPQSAQAGDKSTPSFETRRKRISMAELAAAKRQARETSTLPSR